MTTHKQEWNKRQRERQASRNIQFNQTFQEEENASIVFGVKSRQEMTEVRSNNDESSSRASPTTASITNVTDETDGDGSQTSPSPIPRRRYKVQFAFPLVTQIHERPKVHRQDRYRLFYTRRDISEFRQDYIRVKTLCQIAGLNATAGTSAGQNVNDVQPVRTRDDRQISTTNSTTLSLHHILLRDMFLFNASLFRWYEHDQHCLHDEGTCCCDVVDFVNISQQALTSKQ